MKRKSVKIVALALSLICCFSTAVLLASAEKQTQTYEFSDNFYTSRTSTRGSYSAVYVGNYYGAGNGSNGGNVTSSAVGGSKMKKTLKTRVAIPFPQRYHLTYHLKV